MTTCGLLLAVWVVTHVIVYWIHTKLLPFADMSQYYEQTPAGWVLMVPENVASTHVVSSY